MSRGPVLGLSAFPTVLYLCQDETVLFGGSLGLALQAKPFDPTITPHDLDLIFTSRAQAVNYIRRKLDTQQDTTVVLRNKRPYIHWTTNVCGVHVCMFVNESATVGATTWGIRLQVAEEITKTKAEIYNGSGSQL